MKDKRARRAFTLIELLIVIAIIAILALIAIPNFLEAQTRAKVSRVQADMRTVATALEAYFVDYNAYPETRRSASPYNEIRYRGFIRKRCEEGATRIEDQVETLTTPIAYLSSAAPYDPFLKNYAEYGPLCEGCWEFSYWYNNILGAANARLKYPTQWETVGPDPADVTAPGPLRFNGPDGKVYHSNWTLTSAGPDTSYKGPTHMSVYMLFNQNYWDFFTVDGHFEIYDPTNGTLSSGDIWRFSGAQ